jgi:hypothetical protein
MIPEKIQEGTMTASKSKKTNQNTNQTNDQYVDVLYQKLGDNWFAFSLIDDEVFMSPVSEDKITEIKNDKIAFTQIPVDSENSNEAA